MKQDPYDTHILVTHMNTPKRLYSAARDRYFEALIMENLRIVQHLDGLDVDSSDPQNVIVSASLAAQQAYFIENAESVVFRRSADGEKWKVISRYRPQYNGTIITILASNPINTREYLLSTTVEYFALMILVFPEQCLIFRGLKNILYSILRRLQMGNNIVVCKRIKNKSSIY